MDPIVVQSTERSVRVHTYRICACLGTRFLFLIGQTSCPPPNQSEKLNASSETHTPPETTFAFAENPKSATCTLSRVSCARDLMLPGNSKDTSAYEH